MTVTVWHLSTAYERLGLETVSRRSRVSSRSRLGRRGSRSRSRLGLVCKRLGLVSVSGLNVSVSVSVSAGRVSAASLAFKRCKCEGIFGLASDAVSDAAVTSYDVAKSQMLEGVFLFIMTLNTRGRPETNFRCKYLISTMTDLVFANFIQLDYLPLSICIIIIVFVAHPSGIDTSGDRIYFRDIILKKRVNQTMTDVH